jgi:putative transposase
MALARVVSFDGVTRDRIQEMEREMGDGPPPEDLPAIALTACAFRARLAEHGIVHRRGGYRDPESQAFIESWFSKLKERCVWRGEFETLEQARAMIGAYIDGYHHRPHSGLAYRTPREVAATWKDHDDQLTPAA